MPALRALARSFPSHRRVLAAPGWLTPLARHIGAVDALVDAAPLAPLPAELRDIDVAVNLHGRGPQSTDLLAARSPGRLIAFDVPGGPRWPDGGHERERWCRLLREAGIPADPGDLHVDAPVVAGFDDLAGATVIHPGASTAARRWPVERWASVAEAEANAGRRVVVTGTASEALAVEAVARAAGLPSGSVLAGRTDLLDLLALVGVAGRVVSGDTGVAHVASALRTPSVVLFGPTSPEEWGPPEGPHLALWHGQRGDPHASRPDAGLLAITVEEVLEALDRLPRAALSR